MKAERLSDAVNAATLPDGPIGLRALQRRTLRVLVAAQVFAGLGGSAVTAGSLLAFDVTSSTALASLLRHDHPAHPGGESAQPLRH